MVGKGRKRREKNYKAAHGGDRNRLPPPPNPSQVDAIPSKLKQIMSFSTSSSTGETDEISSGREVRLGRNRGTKGAQEAGKVENTQGSGGEGAEKLETKKKKRKRPQAEDLRFENDGSNQWGQKRRERKKKFLEAKRNKKQKKNQDAEESFPGREHVQFGEVVQAPPKLLAVPKVVKNAQDAYKERLRSQAIEAYRSRKGWTNRPGFQLPSLDLATSL